MPGGQRPKAFVCHLKQGMHVRVLGYLPTIYLEIFKIMYFENVLSNFNSLFQGYMMGTHDIQLMNAT